MTQPIVHSVEIDAPPADVWRALTTPSVMVEWMAEPEMRLDVEVEWTVGAPITMRGVHHAPFRNTGTVLRVEPERALAYTHLSSLSRLPDVPENHTRIAFALAPVARGTTVTLTLDGFPTESIVRHLDFYWRGTLGVLKRVVERRCVSA